MSHFELVVEVVLPRRWEGFRCCPLPFARQVLLQTSELRPQRSFVVPWVACLVGTGVAKEGQERRRTVVLHLLPHWLGMEGHLGLTTPFFVLCFVWFAASIPHSVRSFEEGGQGQEHSSTSREGSCPCFEDEEEFRRVLSSSPTTLFRFRLSCSCSRSCGRCCCCCYCCSKERERGGRGRDEGGRERSKMKRFGLKHGPKYSPLWEAHF